jgi:hypothetical protein
MVDPSPRTVESVRGFVSELVSSLPILVGIDEFIPGCVVADMDPYGLSPALPRMIRVAMRGDYEQDVMYRGNTTLVATDVCTVVHFAEGDQYEVYGGGGSGGGSGANWPLGYPTYDARYVMLDGSNDPITGNITINTSSATALLVEDTGVNDDVLVVDTSNNIVWSAGAFQSALGYQKRGEASTGLIFPGANQLAFNTATGSAFFAQMNSPQYEAVINDGGVDMDFRVEADTHSRAFFLQASDGNIGFGAPVPLIHHAHIWNWTDIIGLVIEGHSSQSVNLQEWHDSASAVLAYVSAAGGAYFADTLQVDGETLFGDKIKFTQLDGNEFIDSLNDGYVDYGATTQHRFNREVQITGNLEFLGAQSITTTINALTLAPASNLVLNPGGDVLFSKDAATDQPWVSGLNGTGWGISYVGHADFRSIFSEEIRTYAFTAEVYNAMAGALIITESRAKVSQDFTIPDTGLTATLYVEDLEGVPNTAVFDSAGGDYVCLRVMTRPEDGQGLIVTDVYGQVTVYTDLADGEQSWTWTTTTTGYSSADVIYAGSIALDYGKVNSGVWMATVIDAAGSPYSQVQTWDTVTNGEPDNFTTHTRVGNLDGIGGIGAEYGLYAGTGTGVVATDSYVVISDTQASLHNVTFDVYYSGQTVFAIDPSVPSYALGTPVPSGFNAGSDGVWAGLDGGLYKWRVGDANGVRAEWDGAEFSIFDDSNEVVFEVDANGAWLSNLAISSEFSDFIFTAEDQWLFGPNCEIDGAGWTTLRGQYCDWTNIGVQMVAGPWPGTQAPVFEVSGTNYVTDPIFGHGDLTEWLTYGTPGAYSTARFLYGDASLYLNSVGATMGAQFRYTTAVNDWWCASGWFYLTSYTAGNFFIRLNIHYDDATMDAFTTTGDTTKLNQWQYLARVGEANGAKTVDWVAVVAATGDTPTSQVYADGIQLHQKPNPTTLICGDFDWCTWNGTPHASSSVRNGQRGEIKTSGDPLDLDAGSLVITFQMPCDAGDYTYPGNNGLWRWFDNWNTESIYVTFSSDYTNLYTRIYAGSAQTVGLNISLAGLKRGSWHQYALTLDSTGSGEANLYFDGEWYWDDTSYTAPTIVTDDVYIGYMYNYSNCAIAEVATFNKVLTDREVGAIWQKQGPIVDSNPHGTPGIYILDGRFSLNSSTSGARTRMDNTGWYAYDEDGDEVFGLSLVDSLSWGGFTINKGDLVLGDNVASSAAILWDRSAGTFGFYGNASATVQVQIDTTGRLLCGAGDVVLDSTGIAIECGTGGSNTIRFIPSGDTNAAGYIRTAATGSLNTMSIYCGPGDTGDDGDIHLTAQSSAATLAETAAIYIEGDTVPQIELRTANAIRFLVTDTLVSVSADFLFRVGTATSDIATGVEDGCLYYNTSTDKLRLRANGAWVSLN